MADPLTLTMAAFLETHERELGAERPLHIFYAYIITNKINDKKYVGITSRINKRIKEHARHSKSGKFTLYMAIKKYGIENFTFDVVACSNTKEGIIEIEKNLILQYNSFAGNGFGYNMTVGGEGMNGISHSEESKAKIREKNLGRKPTEEQLAKMRLAANTEKSINEKRKRATGKYASLETREKMSVSRAGKKLSEEHKEKIRYATLIAKKDWILKIDREKHQRAKPVITPSGTFASLTLACEAHGISRPTGRKYTRTNNSGWQFCEREK